MSLNFVLARFKCLRQSGQLIRSKRWQKICSKWFISMTLSRWARTPVSQQRTVAHICSLFCNSFGKWLLLIDVQTHLMEQGACIISTGHALRQHVCNCESKNAYANLYYIYKDSCCSWSLLFVVEEVWLCWAHLAHGEVPNEVLVSASSDLWRHGWLDVSLFSAAQRRLCPSFPLLALT